MSVDENSGRKLPKMLGRERDDNDSRLNAFKQVRLGNRDIQEEISWVLFDKNDPHHSTIPSEIYSERELPHGALVVSVDLTPLSQAEIEEWRKQDETHGEKTKLPLQSHAVYITGREGQLKALKSALTRTVDKRTHGDEYNTPQNTNYGVPVTFDRPDPEHDCTNYHMLISGNNHPESPVEGLRRITTGGSLFRMIERMSVEGPSSASGYINMPLMANKYGLMSPHLAKEFFLEVSEQVRRRTSNAEEGLFQRLQWPEGEANSIQSKLENLAKMDDVMIKKGEDNRRRFGGGASRLVNDTPPSMGGPSART